jgi:hypothetical protein
MKKLLLPLFLLLATAGFAQSSGQGQGFAVPSNQCPGNISAGWCIGPDGSFKVLWTDLAGVVHPYSLPTNMGAGSQATVSVGTVTALPAGSAPTVVDSDPSANVKLDFGLVNGKDGKDGAAGATGATGATGSQGPQGIQGVPGKDFTSAKGFTCDMIFNGTKWIASNCLFN